MKFRCNRSVLSSAFQIVSGVVPSRTSKEVLHNIKLHLADGQATLIGSDHEIGMRVVLSDVETESNGEILLPAQRTMAILRELTDDTVEIEVNSELIMIRAGQSLFEMGAADPATFPPVPEFSGDTYHSIQSRILKQMIRRTVFATDLESSRFALGGVLWEFNDDRLTLAATDSRRLAVVHAEAHLTGEPTDQNAQPVIPSKAMSLLERCLGDDEEDVMVAIHMNDAIIKTGSTTLSCRLVDGRFPDYRKAIPANPAHQIDLVTGPFYSAVRQSLIVPSEESRGVTFEFSDGDLTLKSRSEKGVSEIQLPISYSGDTVMTIFDSKFVADFLRVLEPESNVSIELTDGDSPVALRADQNYLYIIMPLAGG